MNIFYQKLNIQFFTNGGISNSKSFGQFLGNVVCIESVVLIKNCDWMNETEYLVKLTLQIKKKKKQYLNKRSRFDNFFSHNACVFEHAYQIQ